MQARGKAMSGKLLVRFMLPTVVIVLLVLVSFGLAMTHYLGSDIRKGADREAVEKTAELTTVLITVDSLSLATVHAAMKVLMAEGKRIGVPESGGKASVSGTSVPDLRLGSASQVGRFELVDRIRTLFDCTATLFVKNHDQYVQVFTNVLKPDDSRATGTVLDPKGKAYAAIEAGKPFYGVVDLLGVPYMTGYEPMRDQNNQVLGVWYVGYPLTALAGLGKQISSATILSNGYVALLKRDGTVVFKSPRVKDEDIRRRIEHPNTDGWVVTSQPFEKWRSSLLAAYPEADVTVEVRRVQLIVALCALIMAGLLVSAEFSVLNRLVLRPIHELVKRLQTADVNTSLQADFDDEIGMLAMAFNGFIGHIRETLLRVASAAAQLADSSEQLRSTSRDMSSDAAATSSQVHLVSTAANEVSDNIRSVAEAAEQMRVTAKDIAKNVDQAARVAKEAVHTAQGANANVAKLGESGLRIGEVIKVITSIAKQTNLLALNATIEAERAGEAGRGFAVVANEVKKLARQTANATEEIRHRILAIQDDTKGAVSALASVSEIIHQIDNISAAIAGAVEEQSTTTSHISRNAADAMQAGAKIAGTIHGVATAAESTAQGAAGSQESAQRLLQLSTLLGNLVDEFKLSTSPEPDTVVVN
jgi:methyl-accepting chemotaxis protein